MSAGPIDWKNIIYKGAESDELDYKAAQNWNELSRGGRAKFVRHCLAMANTKGGYIVVGVGEDSNGRPAVFSGLTEEQSKSFDPTAVGNFISRFSDPPVDFSLERPVVDGKCYAVFVIKPFRELPHVCPANCETELQRGVFYIRTKDASSRPAYRATELHSIIQRALRNQREMLGRMLRGILYENNLTGTETDHSSPSFFAEELLHSRMFFNKKTKKSANTFLMEFFVMPKLYQDERSSLSDLKHAAEEAFSFYREPGPLTDFYFPDNYFTNTSFRGFNSQGNGMMQLWRSGMVHFIGQLPFEVEGEITFHTLALFLVRAIVFSAKYYSALGYADDLLELNFRMEKTENLILKSGGFSGRCRIPEILIRKERSASDLASGYETHAAKFLRSVSERFNFESSGDIFFENAVKNSLRK